MRGLQYETHTKKVKMEGQTSNPLGLMGSPTDNNNDGDIMDDLYAQMVRV